MKDVLHFTLNTFVFSEAAANFGMTKVIRKIKTCLYDAALSSIGAANWRPRKLASGHLPAFCEACEQDICGNSSTSAAPPPPNSGFVSYRRSSSSSDQGLSWRDPEYNHHYEDNQSQKRVQRSRSSSSSSKGSSSSKEKNKRNLAGKKKVEWIFKYEQQPS